MMDDKKYITFTNPRELFLIYNQYKPSFVHIKMLHYFLPNQINNKSKYSFKKMKINL